jgi:hypothetical protein
VVLLAALLNYSTTRKMEAIRSSETSGTTQRTTRRHIPEDDTLQDNYMSPSSVISQFYLKSVKNLTFHVSSVPCGHHQRLQPFI